MNSFKYTLIIFSTVFLLSNISFAKSAPPDVEGPSTPESIDLHNCNDEGLGVKFLCNPDWALETEDNVMLIIINEDPAVTMTVAKSDSPVLEMGQLTTPIIKALGQYEEGFSTQMIEVDGIDTLQVDGFASEYPDIRLQDYYFIRDYRLYSVLFSVNPKEAWLAYQKLFDKIIKSVKTTQ